MKERSYKWWLLAFLFVTFILEQGTRQVYNAALPQIRLDFLSYGVTDTQLGMVGTVFGAVFGICLVGSGLAADFIGRKRVLVVGTLLFSLGVFGSGFAEGLACLLVCYGVLNAMGQCCIAPPCYSLISQYHGLDTRSTAMTIFQSAVYIGVIVSSVFAGGLAESGDGGWRWAFWISGGLGIAWAAALQADGPVVICLTRQTVQNLPIEPAKIDVAKGAYVASEDADFDTIIMATGSEVGLAINAAELLRAQGKKIRVVSMLLCPRMSASFAISCFTA